MLYPSDLKAFHTASGSTGPLPSANDCRVSSTHLVTSTCVRACGDPEQKEDQGGEEREGKDRNGGERWGATTESLPHEQSYIHQHVVAVVVWCVRCVRCVVCGV